MLEELSEDATCGCSCPTVSCPKAIEVKSSAYQAIYGGVCLAGREDGFAESKSVTERRLKLKTQDA